MLEYICTQFHLHSDVSCITRVGQNNTFIGIYGVHTVCLAGKSPYIRLYTVQIYGYGQHYASHRLSLLMRIPPSTFVMFAILAHIHTMDVRVNTFNLICGSCFANVAFFLRHCLTLPLSLFFFGTVYFATVIPCHCQFSSLVLSYFATVIPCHCLFFFATVIPCHCLFFFATVIPCQCLFFSATVIPCHCHYFSLILSYFATVKPRSYLATVFFPLPWSTLPLSLFFFATVIPCHSHALPLSFFLCHCHTLPLSLPCF